MLSVVVDDHEMAITHVIRGDDHLTNTARQIALYDALGWGTPTFAHIPLIHGADGAKLSKRHGALGVEAYRDMGYLPETLRNYLLRLGWSHGDEEIISSEDALRWFDLDAVGRSPSRLDLAKLDNLNGHYLRQGDDARLVDLVVPLIEARVGHAVDETGRGRLQAAMAGLKERAKTVLELSESADFYVIQRPMVPDEKASALLNAETRANLAGLAEVLAAAEAWTVPVLEEAVRAFAEAHGLKLGKLAQPLRAALTGRTTSPPIFDVLAVLGREESLARMADAALPR
jgi:glutamyl-tRNA synthetase